VDHSFGSPTGRSSRNRKEGLRGNERSPVGTPRIVHLSVEKVVLRPPQLSPQRPATSFDARSEIKSSSNDINPLNGVEPTRKPWFAENLTQPKSVEHEIFQARARLHSTRQPRNPSSTSTEQRKDRLDTNGYDPKAKSG
jgi:hypothetical protein